MQPKITIVEMLCQLATSGSDIASHLFPLHALASLCAEPSRPVVELGVRDGNSTIALLTGCARQNANLFSYDIDPSCDARVRQRLPSPLGDRWYFQCSDSVAAANGWPASSIPLIFLDTSHEYEHTKRELAAWVPKLVPGGVLCGHDFLLSGAGVQQAVCESLRNFDVYVLPHDHGLFVGVRK